MSGVPRPLRFYGSLEGLTEFREAVLFMITVYYSEWMVNKVSRGKRRIRQSPGESGQKLVVFLYQ